MTAADRNLLNLLKTIVMLLTLMLALQGIIIWRTFTLERQMAICFAQSILSREPSLGLPENQPAPEFQLEEITLETFAGRPFLLVFSDMKCPHCIEMHSGLLAFHHAHPDFHILMFLRGTPPEDLQKSGIRIVPWNEGIAEVYQVPGTPWFYLIDETGVIRASFTAKTKARLEQITGTLADN